MPVSTTHLARASKLVQSYVLHQRAHRKHLVCYLAFAKCHPQALELDSVSTLDPLSDLSSATTRDGTQDTGSIYSETAS
jgi:hypothetical protein